MITIEPRKIGVNIKGTDLKLIAAYTSGFYYKCGHFAPDNEWTAKHSGFSSRSGLPTCVLCKEI